MARKARFLTCKRLGLNACQAGAAALTNGKPKAIEQHHELAATTYTPTTLPMPSRNKKATTSLRAKKGDAFVFAIVGGSNAGKTTVAKEIYNMLNNEGETVTLIAQDNYYLPPDKVERFPRSRPDCDEEPYYNYDSISAIDIPRLTKAILDATHRGKVVIVEGGFLTESSSVMELVDRILFLTIDQDVCRTRRRRKEYDPPDVEGYFDEVVWPSYFSIRRNAMTLARHDKRYVFYDMSSRCEVSDVVHSLNDDLIRITFNPLDVEEATQLVRSPSCGATSIFIGTTRDSFNDREVLRLDYDSYDEMVYKEMRRVCSEIRARYPTVERIVCWHRIGEVAVEETSVIVAAASPHREEAMHAVEMGIDEIKRRVPIWKKEVYKDGGCAWKENGEWRTMKEPQKPPTTEERAFANANRTRDHLPKLLWLQQKVREMCKTKSPSPSKLPI